MEVVTRVRGMRAELRCRRKAPLTLHLDPATRSRRLPREHEAPAALPAAAGRRLGLRRARPRACRRDLVAGVEIGLHGAEAAALDGRGAPALEGELDKLEGRSRAAEARLGDDGFLGKAPAQVVEQQRASSPRCGSGGEQLRQGLASERPGNTGGDRVARPLPRRAASSFGAGGRGAGAAANLRRSCAGVDSTNRLARAIRRERRGRDRGGAAAR